MAESMTAPTPEATSGGAAESAATATLEPSKEPELRGSGSRATLPGVIGPRRPARYALEIQFERREGDPEMGRLVESTVWINEAHPAYERAAASRSEGYHVALSVAMALAPLAVEPPRERAFVQAFLESWGEALRERPARRRGR